MKISNNAPPSQLPVIDGARKSKDIAKRDGVSRPGAVAGGSDVTISDDAHLMNKAQEIAHGAPDMRADRVRALKSQIESGTYQVDAGAVADRLLEEHLNTDFGRNNL